MHQPITIPRLSIPCLTLLLFAAAAGCSHYTGSARDTRWPPADRDGNWTEVTGLEGVKQSGEMDCGSAALTSVLRFWGKPADRRSVDVAVRPKNREGAPAGLLRDHARKSGLNAFLIAATFDDLQHELDRGRPILVGMVKPHGREGLLHYEVVVGLERGPHGAVVTFDPAHGWRRNSRKGFTSEWRAAQHLALVIYPRDVAESGARNRPLEDPPGGEVLGRAGSRWDRGGVQPPETADGTRSANPQPYACSPRPPIDPPRSSPPPDPARGCDSL